MDAVAVVIVVRLHIVLRSVKKPLRAALRGQVVELARVLGHLKTRLLHSWVSELKQGNVDGTLIDHCLLATAATPLPVLPRVKDSLLQQSLDSTYTELQMKQSLMHCKFVLKIHFYG